jgi:uncharacterized protein (TIGR00369 family)
MEVFVRTLNPEYVKMICKLAETTPYFQLLSMRILHLEIGACDLEIPIQAQKHMQPFGVVHGGVFASIIDAAAFWAVFPEIDEDKGMTTVDLKINYLAPAVTGVLRARGTKIKVGQTLSLGEARVTDGNGKLLAHGTSTLITLPISSFQVDGSAMPRKFLL